MNNKRLTGLEGNVIVQYVLDLDSREFSHPLRDVQGMANVIDEPRDASRVGTRWASNFVK